MLSKLLNVRTVFLPIFLVLSWGAFYFVDIPSLFGADVKTQLSFLLFCLTAVVVTFFAYQNESIRSKGFFLYLILLWFFCFGRGEQSLSFSTSFFFLTLLWTQLLTRIEKKTVLFTPFDFGFYAVVVSVCNTSFLLFSVYILFYTLVNGIETIKKLALVLFGMLASLFLFAELSVVFDASWLSLFEMPSISLPSLAFTSRTMYLVPILFLSMHSLWQVLIQGKRQTPIKQKFFLNVFYLFFFALGYLLFFATNADNGLLLLGMPLALLISNELHYSSKAWKIDLILGLYTTFLLLYAFDVPLELPTFLEGITF